MKVMVFQKGGETLLGFAVYLEGNLRVLHLVSSDGLSIAISHALHPLRAQPEGA